MKRSVGGVILLNPVLLSVISMFVLCLFGLNVIFSLIIAALIAGILSGMPVTLIMDTFASGTSGNAEVALGYILLGAFAVAIHHVGLADVMSKLIAKIIKGKAILFILLIAFVAMFSQNLIPIHIAFIPILIPPLLHLMNKLQIDRRAMACGLTFGLQFPYVMIPLGYGMVFHGILANEITANGITIHRSDIWKALWPLGIGLLAGLFFAVFVSYRKKRKYEDKESNIASSTEPGKINFTKKHFVTLIGASMIIVAHVLFKSLPLGAVMAIGVMVIFKAIKWKDVTEFTNSGIGMMGFVAFVMLLATGYGNVIRATGSVPFLVNDVIRLVGDNRILTSTLIILVGLVVSMGLGTSFGTVPILAVIFVPLAIKVGYSPFATVILIATAAAVGDAASPASDSTLGPTAGLNADKQHDHIWDTCIPTFSHYTIALTISGIIGSLIL